MKRTLISLCTGTGQLERALGLAGLDIELTAVSDLDAGAITFLRHHYPDVPNLGDLRKIDWPSLDADIVTAGFPCQPVSASGVGRGVNDERWLFDDITEGVSRMGARPRLLVFENVPGLLTANRGHAMARVVQGLASIGYVGRYRLLRASDVGAVHRRERVFIVAWPADSDGIGLGIKQKIPASRRGEGRPLAAEGSRGTVPLSSSPTMNGVDCEVCDPSDNMLPLDVARDIADGQWGKFAATIARWEQIIGRPAPYPIEDDDDNPGEKRLVARFTEWMQGLDDGEVCDVPGLTRDQQLKLIGNGIVKQQGAYAIRLLTGEDQ